MGELKRDLIKALRQAHNKRVPRSKGQDRRGKFLTWSACQRSGKANVPW
jgi:hypothetical protein